MTNPYEDLPPRAFWRTAVAGAAGPDTDALWDPKFPIRRTDRVAALGSCFAQHISRALVAEGYNWLNGEPAPPRLSDADKRRFNYEVFSARTANIYTVALLRQWTQWCLGEAPAPDEVWHEGGRFYDPFRPAIEPGGFDSPQEVTALRRQTIRALRSVFETCDVLVFTLGLTESWINTVTGQVYPMCPGTSAGTFDARSHRFHNAGFSEIHADLTDVLRMLRGINPSLKLLLTVSPVPLTATASGDHVLSATIRSKSILRAVAATVVAEDDGVDYFPSYEIVSSFPFGGRFYAPNLRSVTPEGVATVMRCFFRALGCRQGGAPASADHVPAAGPAAGRYDEGDVVCEEMALDRHGP